MAPYMFSFAKGSRDRSQWVRTLRLAQTKQLKFAGLTVMLHVWDQQETNSISHTFLSPFLTSAADQQLFQSK